MTKILWLSFNAPYDNVKHAGGKTFNYYLKKICGCIEFEVKVITFVWDEEFDDVTSDLKLSSIDYTLIPRKKVQEYSLIDKLSHYNIFNFYAGFIDIKLKNKMLLVCKSLSKEEYQPDNIILEWTQVTLLISDLKTIFPEAKYIASEHDIATQSYYRYFQQEKNKFTKMYYFLKYKQINKVEIKSLNICDRVLVHNKKDLILLQDMGCKAQVKTISPFIEIPRKEIWKYDQGNRNVIFFGAMERRENYEAAEWIIKNIATKMTNLDFYIIGNNPPSTLSDSRLNNVIVTGYVENVESYFEKCICLIAPLFRGAGIKVKVLQAMAMGVPILTNDIGIEGIDAISGEDFIECITKEDYIQGIFELQRNSLNAQKLSKNGRKLIDKQFRLDISEELYKIILRGNG